VQAAVCHLVPRGSRLAAATAEGSHRTQCAASTSPRGGKRLLLGCSARSENALHHPTRRRCPHGEVRAAQRVCRAFSPIGRRASNPAGRGGKLLCVCLRWQHFQSAGTSALSCRRPRFAKRRNRLRQIPVDQARQLRPLHIQKSHKIQLFAF
jgi:hypothetical protein